MTTNLTYGQSRFFIFTEGWMTSSALELDDYYAIIGTGDISNNNHINITTINKIGEHIDVWNVLVNDAVESETKNQQSLNCYNHQKVMGVTVVNESESLVKARRLFLNNDLTVVIDSSWQYTSPQGDESIMFITHREQANTIVHGLNYYDGNTVNSTLLSTDTLGNMIWESNFSCGGTYCWMEPRHIHTAHDGGYIFTNNERRGFAEGGIVGELDIGTIIKTDSFGVQQWRIRPGGIGEPYTSEHIVLQPTDDGNYLCAWADNHWRTSDGDSFDHYNLNPGVTIWFAKIDPHGNKIWEKNIAEDIQLWGTEEIIYLMDQMIRLPDGNFALTSYDQVIKINQNAEVIWARRVRPPELINTPEQYSELYVKGITVTSDGGFICTGELQIEPGNTYPEFTQTGFVLKLDEYGCLEEGCHLDDPVVSVEEVVSETSNLSIYPNPTSRDITINYHLPQIPNHLILSIHNIAGKAVHTQPLPPHEGSARIELGKNLPAGTYFCHLIADGQVLGVERFVLLR